VSTQVIGANEYEGHFAFDLLYNNSSDIQPNTLSTDTHGTNNVNFAILDFFGYTFAPRYAKMKKVFFELFEVTEENGGRIQLKKDINHKLIAEEWDNIQHIVCSLSRKTTTQSTIIRKLSNGKSRRLSALHEYDRLIKSIYVLEYVDNSTLRHYVQQALNRGEAYHQLKRAITSVNGNKFRGGMITKYHNGTIVLDSFQIALFIIIPRYYRHFYKSKRGTVGKMWLMLFLGFHLLLGNTLI